jgi:hypothetical protein
MVFSGLYALRMILGRVWQVLKIIRYTTKLVLATWLSGSDTELARRLKAFESSIGTSR